MRKSDPLKLLTAIVVNGFKVTHIVIGLHYREKHASYMSDDLVIDLVQALDGKNFKADSTSKGIEYYAADISFSKQGQKDRIYRLVWLFEGNFLEIIGVINAYRVKKQRK